MAMREERPEDGALFLYSDSGNIASGKFVVT
jgi:hypothetical protein